MTPEQKLAALLKEGNDLRIKSKSAPLSDDDQTRAVEIAAEAADVRATIARTKQATDALSSMGEPTQDSADENPQLRGTRKAATLGQMFVQSKSYDDFKAEHPSGVESHAGKETPIRLKAVDNVARRYAQKDLLTTGTMDNDNVVRTNEVDDLVFRPERRLLEVITRGTTALTHFEYRQVIGKTNNAAIVAEATTSAQPTANTTTGVLEYPAGSGLKPLSTLSTRVQDAKAYTYADGMEVTNQELSDDGVIQSLIDSTLAENLEIEMENILLNGSGVDGEPAGIMNTTGVLQQAFVTDAPTSVRKALTQLRTTSGAQIRGVLLNPEDDEAWDLLKDLDGRYLGNGPFGTGPGTAWGYERIISQAIPVGQAIIGDFKTIHLLQREALTILAFNQHLDFARRNLTYIRAELRALQLIRNAAKLCVVDLVAG